MVAAARRFVNYRDLLSLLVTKELKVKYKGTALGLLWSLLNPLLMMVVYTIVFSNILRFSVPHYAIFLLSGLLPWTAFTASLTGATVSVTHSWYMVRKLYFPYEFLPLTSVFSAFINLLPSIGILFIFALVMGQPLGAPLLALPLVIAIELTFTVGIALLLSAATVYFRDVEYLVNIAITVWFFATPIIYPLSIFKGRPLAQLLLLNPMTWMIDSYQRIWHENAWPQGSYLAAAASVAVLSLLIGSLVFQRLQRRFAEEV
jgi:lipopolysaccharide transport system permease protein